MKNKITIRLFPPTGFGHLKAQNVIHAPKGKIWTEQSMEDVLDKVIEDLDARFPLWNFRAVRIGQWQWNFVFDGLRVESPVEVLPGTIMQNKEEEANA